MSKIKVQDLDSPVVLFLVPYLKGQFYEELSETVVRDASFVLKKYPSDEYSSVTNKYLSNGEDYFFALSSIN